jgi:SAM-dependent methyltransferase
VEEYIVSNVLIRLTGEKIDISSLSVEDLTRVHYEEEVAYGNEILKTPPFSQKRVKLMKEGYKFITKIMKEFAAKTGKKVNLGSRKIYFEIIEKVLTEYKKKSFNSNRAAIRFFEAGIGTGLILKDLALLEDVDASGCDIIVDLVTPLPDKVNVYEGTVHDVLSTLPDSSIDIFYWNDVFEHIPVDEINPLLEIIHSKLSHNGIIITVTPNWHLRPTNITETFHPHGTEAKGFHFKEYTYNAVTGLLENHGFKVISSPYIYNLFAKKYIINFNKIALLNHKIKCMIEPVAAVLPFFLKRYLILGFAFSTTIAKKY